MAATSVATFMRIFSTLCATGYGEVQSVFIVGIVPPPMLVENFAPTTGVTTAGKMRAEAIAGAQRAAREAATLLPAKIGARHCSVNGWGDDLVRLLTTSGCECLFVDAANVSGRRRRGLRKRLSRAGITLVIVGGG